MTYGTYFDACKSYIICQILHAKEDKDKHRNTSIHPFVTISREAGAGGTSAAQKLVEYLNENDKMSTCPWALFDKNLIEKVIEEHNLPTEFGMFMPENKVSEMQSVFEQLFGLHPPQSKLVDKISHTILHLAQLGNVVIVGRGANIITRHLPGGFQVRLIGTPESRLKHIENFYHLDRKEALKFMKKEDFARRNYVKRNFSRDVSDNLLYDMVINTSNVTLDSAVQIIGMQVLEMKHQLIHA
jgi:cytidylate kinase